MKLIREDFLDYQLCDFVPFTIDIILSKLDSKYLDSDDYDMIKHHLIFYKNLLLDAKKYGKND